MSNLQIGLLALKYVNNLNVSNDATTPNTQLDVAAGQTRDSTNTNDIVLSSGVVIDATKNDVNGLDTGNLAASTWYCVYLISSSLNQKPTAALLSLSTTAPTLPSGYDIFKLIGYWLTDGSAHFLKGYVVGNGGAREHVWDTPIQVITNGTATSATAVDLSAAVPNLGNTLVQLNARYLANAADDHVTFLAGASSATTGPTIYGSAATHTNSGQIEVLAQTVSGLPKIQYINSAAAGSTNAYVQKFKYFI